MNKLLSLFVMITVLASCQSPTRMIHVSPDGDDSNPGSARQPLKTISAASLIAEPGQVISIHEGIYRERINPTRGGSSDDQRITYQAAPGEKVVIKGSEVWNQWNPVSDELWMARIPNSFFGDFNPFRDEIAGDWFWGKNRVHHTGAVYLNGHWLIEAGSMDSLTVSGQKTPYWYAESDTISSGETRIWALFHGVNPNEELVEINVRKSVFYPDETGLNYITVSGLTLEHAATNWAPPTAEQVGLIGVNWSKGWIIENNTIRYSTCVGVTLGKHGDEFDNTSANSAEGYVKTIERGLAAGWSKENIGHHIVRNNVIAHCEQAGIVGSLGPVFSEIYGNIIHDIHIRQLFTGAEMAGIKLHGAVDVAIHDNHIYRCNRGIWLDWMAQGTHVYRNVLHDNAPDQDLFMEVNHGPALIDHNFFLSPNSLLVNSQGEAYAHNVFAGQIYVIHGEQRLTPYLEEHGTNMVGLAPNPGGDQRFYNNIFTGAANLSMYDAVVLEVINEGNVYSENPVATVSQSGETWQLNYTPDPAWSEVSGAIVSTELLGKTAVPGLSFVHPDGSAYFLDEDYSGLKRTEGNVFPGPLEPGSFATLPIAIRLK